MKKFIWCTRSSDKVSCIKGPDKKEWQKLIGFSYIHSLEDLFKLPISEVLKYRLDTATEGVIIGIHHLHSNVDLAIRRLSDNEIETMQLEKKLSNSLANIVKQIEDKAPALHVQKKDIENQLSTTRQKIREMNLEGVDP
jgi:ribosomal protein S1